MDVHLESEKGTQQCHATVANIDQRLDKQNEGGGGRTLTIH